MSNAFINQSKVEQTFISFLKTQNVSEKTQTNYIGDVRHFFDWLGQIFKSLANDQDLSTVLKNVTGQTIEDYKNNQIKTNSPTATVNRRLSSVRLFFRWANETGLLPTNPTLQTKNIVSVSNTPEISPESLIGLFEKSLRDEGAADVTIKNYVTDVSEFISWLNRTPSD
jgi:site-specific recombinase XerD